MSKDQEVEQEPQAPVTSEAPLVDQDSPGQQLMRAREKMGISQQDVADRLHLRIGSIIAVENDALEEGVSATFSKGYVRLYARLVNLDAQSLLDAYDKLHVRDRQQPAKLQSFSRRVSREAHDSRWNMVTIVVVLLVLGSVIVWWVQQSDSSDNTPNFVTDTFDSLFNEDEQSDDNDTDENNAEPQALNQDSSNISTQNPSNDAIDTLDTVTEDEQAQDDPFAVISEDEQNALDEVQSPEQNIVESLVDDIAPENDLDDPQQQVQETVQELFDTDLPQVSADLAARGYNVNNDGTVDLVFTFREDCWVSVKDANGETMAVGVKVKGRVMEVSGLPPVRVVLGAPQVVDINFAGQAVDMSIHPSGRSANFVLPLESE